MTETSIERGARIPPEGLIAPTARLRETTLGRRVELADGVYVEYSEIGDFSYLMHATSVADATIGKFTAVAATVRIGAPDHPMKRAVQHRLSYTPEYYWPEQSRDHAFFAARRATRTGIGDDVWIGHGAVILAGVAIGSGAVIAAGAVVTRDVAPYTVVAGVPARPIRRRFPETIADRLLALAWWDWPEAEIAAAVPDFRDLSVEAFIEKYARP
jgi:phosphonate metabolism protein (transferase hexapeptide repeat family)